jgi:nicotinamide riboside transporter PnuC
LFSEGGMCLAEEKIFLDQNGVSVSNLRMMYAGQTYAMRGITSVKLSEEKPSMNGPIVLIVIASLFLIADINTVKTTGDIKGMVVSLILLAYGVFWWQTKKQTKKTEYSVLLTSASGEKKTYTSNDKEFVIKIVTAINNAIVDRG